jgi:hypothetical protein
MSESEKSKAEVRAWLYHLLARLEEVADVEGKQTETAGNKVTIELQFKV